MISRVFTHNHIPLVDMISHVGIYTQSYTISRHDISCRYLHTKSYTISRHDMSCSVYDTLLESLSSGTLKVKRLKTQII